MREPPVATCRPYPGIAHESRRPRQDDALQILPPKARRKPHRVLEVRTGRGAHHPKTVFPRLCRHFQLSQDPSRKDLSRKAPAPAVLDRTDFRKLPEALGTKQKNAICLGSLQQIPQDVQKE